MLNFSYGGLIINVALFIFLYIILKSIIAYFKSFSINLTINNNNKLLITAERPSNILNANKTEPYYLKKEFIEWFVGFTTSSGEGNFNIKLTDLTDNTFKYVQFTAEPQITLFFTKKRVYGLHKDDIKVLEYIKDTLQCGHISKSKDKVNYGSAVNDINSLLYVIIPLFDYVNLNSSKFHLYELFKKAILLTKDKSHLSDKGKFNIIAYQKEMQSMSGKWIPSSINNQINITKYWLAGFIDAEGCFSTNKYVPRFKLSRAPLGGWDRRSRGNNLIKFI